jgi:hypothetical protein
MNTFTITVVAKDFTETDVTIMADNLNEAVAIAEQTYTDADGFIF